MRKKVYSCPGWPSLTIVSRAGMIRFDGGRFETADRAVQASLEAYPWFGIHIHLEAPGDDDQSDDPLLAYTVPEESASYLAEVGIGVELAIKTAETDGLIKKGEVLSLAMVTEMFPPAGKGDEAPKGPPPDVKISASAAALLADAGSTVAKAAEALGVGPGETLTVRAVRAWLKGRGGE